MNYESIGSRIRLYRKNQGLTVDELTKASDISRYSIMRYENNQVTCTQGTCKKIAFGLKIDHLIVDDYLNFISSDYGQAIRLLRKQLSLNQTQFAKLLETTKKKRLFARD